MGQKGGTWVKKDSSGIQPKWRCAKPCVTADSWPVILLTMDALISSQYFDKVLQLTYIPSKSVQGITGPIIAISSQLATKT